MVCGLSRVHCKSPSPANGSNAPLFVSSGRDGEPDTAHISRSEQIMERGLKYGFLMFIRSDQHAPERSIAVQEPGRKSPYLPFFEEHAPLEPLLIMHEDNALAPQAIGDGGGEKIEAPTAKSPQRS